MNDSEKVEAIKKTLSHNLDYKKLIRQYVGFIQDIVDDKMTMKEEDDYINNFLDEREKTDKSSKYPLPILLSDIIQIKEILEAD